MEAAQRILDDQGVVDAAQRDAQLRAGVDVRVDARHRQGKPVAQRAARLGGGGDGLNGRFCRRGWLGQSRGSRRLARHGPAGSEHEDREQEGCQADPGWRAARPVLESRLQPVGVHGTPWRSVCVDSETG